jgi:hypothetical protein
LRRRRAVGPVAAEPAVAQVQSHHVLRIGADPERVAIDRERGHEAVGQAFRVARVVAPGDEALAVVAVQAALGADPDEALRILDEGGDGLLDQPLLAAKALEIELAHRGARGRPRRGRQQQGQDQRCRAGAR